MRYVAPYVGVATSGSPLTASGSVIIRGQGFEQFPVQNVTFNGVSASTFRVVSDTEIEASYTALPAGTYQVQVVAPSSPGSIVSEASLWIVPVTNYGAATTLAYPPGMGVTGVDQLRYDAERQALLLVVTTGSGTELLRYAYSSGGWSTTPATVSSTTLPNLSDIALSTQGGELLALSPQYLTELDPGTLAIKTQYTPGPTPAPAGVDLKNLAVANDGNAIVTTGNSSSASTPLYLFAARNPAFTQNSTTPSLDNATPGASADGSVVALQQGDPSLASSPPVYQYTASSETFASTAAAINQGTIAPALDQSATRIVLNGTDVYDSSFTLLGTLLPTSTTLAVVVSPNADCAYTFDSSGQILAFSLITSMSGDPFPQAGATPVSSPGTTGAVKMAISPDGGTLFLAGSGQIVVAPAPTSQCQ